MPDDFIKKLLKARDNNPRKEGELFKGTRSITGLEYKPESSYIPTRFKKLADKFNWDSTSMDDVDMERAAYLKQSGTDLAMKTAQGFLTQAAAGVVDSVAAYDMKGLYDMAVGNTEQKYGNWLNEIGKNIREYSDKNFEIYQQGDSMWTPEYWAKQGQSLGYTGGIIAETIAEQVALARLTGGAGNLEALASKGRLLNMAKQGLFGMWKGVQEGYMNALETQQQVYQKYKDLGYDDSTSELKANEAASLGFRAEVGPLTALNALQFMSTFGVAKSAFKRGGEGIVGGFSGGAETLMEKMLPSMNGKFSKAGVALGINSLSEGVEEGIQTGVQKYAEHETLKSTGDAQGELKLWDSEMRDSVIGGVLGGALFAGAGKLLSPLTQGTAAKTYSKAHDAFVEDASTRTSTAFKEQTELMEQFKKAQARVEANPSTINKRELSEVDRKLRQAQFNVHLANTANALQLDYINNKTTAYESHVEQMQTILDAVKANDVKALTQYGILDEKGSERYEGALDTIKNTFQENIDNSEFIKNSLEDKLLNVTSDFESAFDITKYEYMNKNNLDLIHENDNKIQDYYSTNQMFNRLSHEAQRRFKVENELQALKDAKTESIYSVERIKELQEDLSNMSAYSAADKNMIGAINSKPAYEAEYKKALYHQSIENNNKDIQDISKPAVIQEKVKERNKKRIKEAKNKAQVDAALEQAQTAGEATPELVKEAEDKISQIQAEQTIKEIVPESQSNTKESQTGIKENSKPPTEQTNQFMSLADLLSSGALQSGGENFSESPRSQQDKDRNTQALNDAIDFIEKDLGKKIDFKDFVSDLITRYGYDRTQNAFNNYAEMWRDSGRELSQESQSRAYNALYNPLDSFMDLADAYPATSEEKQEEIDTQVEQSIVTNTTPAEYTTDNRPTESEGNYVLQGKTSNPTPKAAHLGMNYNDRLNSNGTISRIPSLPALNKSEYISNHNILDPDYLNVGDVLEVSIPIDQDDILVADWTLDSTTGVWNKNAITFGEWREKYKVEIGTPEYVNKVPMIASKGDERTFFLHDLDWYNTTNMGGNTQEDLIHNIRQAKSELHAIRDKVLQGYTNIKIDKRNFGSIFRLNKLADNNDPISISEATGETKLAIAIEYDKLGDYSADKRNPLKHSLVNNLDNNRLQIGVPYELRHVNTVGGEKQYIALPVLSNNPQNGEYLNDTALNNAKYSVLAALLLNSNNSATMSQILENKYSFTLSKAKNIKSSILKTTGYDIETELGKYLNMFVNVRNSNTDLVKILENNTSNEDGKYKYPIGNTYVAFDRGVLKVINKDGNVVPRNQQGYDSLPGINFNSITENSIPVIESLLDQYFGNEGIFKSTTFNPSKEQLGKGRAFTEINPDGTVSNYSSNQHGENTYDGYLKDNFKTNVKSFSITDHMGDTKWITDIQPMVYFSIDNEFVNTVTPERFQSDEIKQEEVELNETKTSLSEVELQALENISPDIAASFLEEEDDSFLYTQRELTSTEQSAIDELDTNRITVLNPTQQIRLEDSIFNLILSNTDISKGTIYLQDLSRRIESSLNDFLQPKINEMKEIRDNWVRSNNAGLQDMIVKMNAKINLLENVMKEKEKLVSRGINSPKGELFKRAERFLSEELSTLTNSQDEDIQADDTGEVEYGFNSSSLEKDVKLSFSNNLKIFFSNIIKQKPVTKQNVVNFSSLNDYINVDEVIDKLKEVMVGLPSSIEDLIAILDSKKYDPIYNQILNKIKNSSEDVQNEVLYKMIQSKLDMHMILYSFDRKTGNYSLKVINPNSSASDIKLKQEWISNFINSDAFSTIKDQRVYNKEVLNNIIRDISGLQQKELTLTALSPIVASLGITINDNTLQDIINTEGANIFTNSGLLGVFKNELQGILDRNKAIQNITLEDESNNPYNNARGVIEDLIERDINLNGTKVSKSFRVGGKTIQGAVQKMMIYDIKDSLKTPGSELVNNLSQYPFSKKNYVLELIKNNSKFRENYDVSFVSLEAIKQNKQKSFGDRKINKLAETDNMLTQYGLFQNTTRDLKNPFPEYNLDFRMGYMFNASLSDKEQMILYNTALVNLNYKNVIIDEDTNIVELGEDVLDFITFQIFDSEFDRIVNTYNNPTNIKNYDGAAKLFLSFPRLNTMKDQNGSDITSLLKAAQAREGVISDSTLNILKDTFREEAKQVINDAIKTDVNSKFNTTDLTGSWVDAGFYDTQDNEVKFFDTKYINSKGLSNTKLSKRTLMGIAANDFVVNQFLNQHSIYQLYAGDMALYAPNIKKATNKATGQVDYVKLNKLIGESVTKRMAMLIAPGSKLANSKNDKYIQIFVNDPVSITSTAREFIQQYYGEVDAKNEKLLATLDTLESELQNTYSTLQSNSNFDELIADLTDKIDSVKSKLAKHNDKIGGYFQIEGTDAQEYTTWKEHMDVLFRQGRLSSPEKAKLQSAYNKLQSGQELDSSELSVVMNPIKPVYAGLIPYRDASGKPQVNRTVYVKSSSFPLLPQLTKDFKLDKIREQMEHLEKTQGKNVRLSYQTANKVGAVKTSLTTDDLYNIKPTDLATKLGDSILELDRENFKIQQDTPYKTAKFLKKNSDDSTTMGSQMWKIILGNGINKINSRIFPNIFDKELLQVFNTELGDNKIPEGEFISGQDLDKIKFRAEKKYFEIQKELLYDELGLDTQTGRPIDMNRTIELIHNLLDREVTTRQYPENMIDNIALIKDNLDQVKFNLPMWLSTSSAKFESLLQAVITNRLIQIKLPGNQHISASSEGFVKVSSNLDSKAMSQVVWIDPNHTGELKATRLDGSSLKESEILIQSKFRTTYKTESGETKTKLIDLTKAPYSSMVDGKLVLNKEMIEEELLSNFSFRIPTSSHQSGAILKVVGFLPEASGDMVVVPKEHTQQIGEDFDIDKRTLYKSNYVIDKQGKISKLRYEAGDANINSLMSALFEDEYAEHLDTDGKNKYKTLKLRSKMLENAMIDVYKSVYQSPSKEVQDRVNKILSFDNATETANLIYNKINSAVDDTNFTTYSDTYQRSQMKLGADGKAGIGVHSNAVTFQAQMERLSENIVVRNSNNDNVEMVIGKAKSDGVLGKIETIDGERTISDVHTENQNSATDNIKAQIMGKRNENAYTMNVLVQLTYRGFDMVPFTPREEGDPSKVQISSLFLAQPILRRMVELKENAKSITSPFESDSNTKVIRQLLEEFGGLNFANGVTNSDISNNTLLDLSDYKEYSSRMTGDELYDNLINEKNKQTWDGLLQVAVLQKFLELDSEARDLNTYQKLINMSTSGLGISYFNVIDRLDTLSDMISDDKFSNITSLIGQVEPFLGEDLLRPGFYKVGEVAIKPETTEGTVLVHALSSAESIMDQLYPYKRDFIRNTIDSILQSKSHDGTREVAKSRLLDLKYEIMNNLKDYFYSSKLSNLFSGNIDSERHRLFFDKDGNKSLASYLKELKEAKKYPLLYTNELLKSFNYDGIRTDGAPSIIKHRNDLSTNFDKTDKYVAFLELLQDNSTDMGTFNGVKMTPRLLAQDLASYSYLGNNENGAIGFRDYVNVKYLDIVGTSGMIRNLDVALNRGLLTPGYFVEQYFQHNPNNAALINTNPESFNIDMFVQMNESANTERNKVKNDPNNPLLIEQMVQKLESFTLDEEQAQPEFISFRNTSLNLTDNQYSLFKYDGEQYVRIPVLGTLGYNEYNSDTNGVSSLIYPSIQATIGENISQYNEINSDNKGTVDSMFNTSSIENLIRDINNKTNDAKFKELTGELLNYILPNTEIRVTDTTSGGKIIKTGAYDRNNNVIYISPQLFDNVSIKPGEDRASVVQEVLLEEMLHALTVSNINKYGYMQENKFIVQDDAPVFMKKLASLFNYAQENIQDYYTQDIYEFVAGVFVSPDFRTRLDSKTRDGKTLLDKFKEMFASMVRYLTGSTYSDNVIREVYELLDRSFARTLPEIQVSSNNMLATNLASDIALDQKLSIDEVSKLLSGLKSGGENYLESPRNMRLPEIKNCK